MGMRGFKRPGGHLQKRMEVCVQCLGDAGRPVPVRVPVRPAALLAVRVPRDPGAGEPLALTLPLQALVTVLR